MENKNKITKVIILGAGASKVEYAPTQSELVECIIKKIESNSKLALFFERSWGLTKQNLHKFKNRMPTMEECYSALEIPTNEPGTPNYYTPADRNEIREMLDLESALVIRDGIESSRGRYRYHKDLIDNILSKGNTAIEEVAFISFNYDIILDNAIRDSIKKYPAKKYAIDYGKDFANYARPGDEKKPILLYKPHGSLNWALCKNCGDMVYTEGEKDVLEHMECKKCTTLQSTVTASPTFFKDFDTLQLSGVHDEMERTLEGMPELWFCGYSFPDADFRFKNMLKRIEQRNSGRTFVVNVVSRSLKPDVADRYKRYFKEGTTINLIKRDFKTFCGKPFDDPRAEFKSVWIVGYGSLMSEHGIHRPGSQTAGLTINDAFIARFKGKRGFNKGSRYAMDVGYGFDPCGARVETRQNQDQAKSGWFECLVFSTDISNMGIIAEREGYPARLIERIKSSAKDLPLADFLWNIYLGSHDQGNIPFNTKCYRRALLHAVNYDGDGSETYLPVPVKIGDTTAIISIFSGPGQKGEESDIAVMTAAYALEHCVGGDREYFKKYLVECLLGGIHGINIDDLLAGIGADPIIRDFLSTQLSTLAVQERERFAARMYSQAVPELDRKQRYEARFGGLHDALQRSGLLREFPGIERAGRAGPSGTNALTFPVFDFPGGEDVIGLPGVVRAKIGVNPGDRVLVSAQGQEREFQVRMAKQAIIDSAGTIHDEIRNNHVQLSAQARAILGLHAIQGTNRFTSVKISKIG